MYVSNSQTHIVNRWSDSEINRQRLASGKYGVTEYTGEIETVNGMMYEKGYAPVPSLEEAKAAKLSEINSACDAAIEEKGKEYPVSERLSFDLQLYEATQYKADNTTETHILSVLAEKRGIELTDLVDRVLAKADEVRAYSASAIGQRQALKDQVDAATTIEEVNAIEVNIVI